MNMKGDETSQEQRVKFVEVYPDQNVSEPEGKYGYLSCKPRWLQACNNIRVMVAFQCLFAFFEGFLVNGVITVIIVALETRYRLSSKLSGLIASGNDFGSFFILLFIGHIAEKRHKPKFMAAGVVSMSIGSFIFVLPHFIDGKYDYVKSGFQSASSSHENLRVNSTGLLSNETSCSSQSSEQGGTFLYPLFLVGQIFLGIGSSPMFTIGLTYIDDNCKAKMTSFYTGLVMCAAALGVAAGYVVAGQTLGVYVDIDKVDIDSIDLTPMDPRWVGAWWIGVFSCGIIFIFIAVPFFAYPKRLPGYNALIGTRKSEAHGDSDAVIQSGHYKGNFKDLPKAFLHLLKNPTFVLLCLAGCLEALIISGTATFGAKLIQLLFHVNIMRAGMLMDKALLLFISCPGFITVPGAGGGMLLGGYLVKRLNLKCVGIIKLCGIVTFLCLFLSPAFLIRCPDAKIAGFTVPYPNESVVAQTSACNQHCSCGTEGMEPICIGGEIFIFLPLSCRLYGCVLRTGAWYKEI